MLWKKRKKMEVKRQREITGETKNTKMNMTN